MVRRLDCVLEPTKEKVLNKLEALQAKGMKASDPVVAAALQKVSGVPFHNTSRLTFVRLKDDPNHVAQNLRNYLKGFSGDARDIVEQFKFDDQVTRLDEANLLYQVIGLFADVDLHPDLVPNHTMGSVFEELIRRFNEKKNEEAGADSSGRCPAMSRPCRTASAVILGWTLRGTADRTGFRHAPLVAKRTQAQV
jgi:type I restriction enzyme M protein